MWKPPADQVVTDTGWRPPEDSVTTDSQQSEQQPYQGTWLENAGQAIGGAMEKAAPYLQAGQKIAETVMPGSGIPEMAQRVGQATLDKLGYGAAELGGKMGYPKTGVAVGTAIQNAPAIIMPGGEGEVALPGRAAIADAAQEAGAKSLGFTKRFLNRPGGIERSKQVAQTMLDQGVIKNPITNPLSSGADSMLERAQILSDKSGQTLGEGLKALDEAGIPSIDTKSIAKQVYAQLRPKYFGGAYEAEHSVANEIKDTILAHGEGPITFESAQELKKKLQDLGHFERAANGMKAEMYQKASGIVRQAIEDSVRAASTGPSTTELALPKSTRALRVQGTALPRTTQSVSPETLSNYQSAKKVYGASEEAEKALTNRFSSEMGNKNIGLTDTIAGAAELARGNPKAAIALVGGKRVLERSYNATKATILDALAKTKLGSATQRVALIAAYLAKRNSGQ